MKCIYLMLVAILVSSQFANAQVKKQFQDNNATTVVVKEDQADDFDVLDSQFDIDDVGMGTIIRIDTEADLPAPNVAEMTAEVGNDMPVQVQETVEAEKTLVVEETIVAAPEKASNIADAPARKTAPGYYTGTYPKYDSKSVSRAYGKKHRAKKRKKRSKTKKRKSGSCYRF